MFRQLANWLRPRTIEPCDHDYKYMSVPLWCGALLTWDWCSKCGEPRPRKEWNKE